MKGGSVSFQQSGGDWVSCRLTALIFLPCSSLCYSSDRQLSFDLVNVGRQRLDFLPMLGHSGTYRETEMHTGAFAQEIISLVHYVKGEWRTHDTCRQVVVGQIEPKTCRDVNGLIEAVVGFVLVQLLEILELLVWFKQ